MLSPKGDDDERMFYEYKDVSISDGKLRNVCETSNLAILHIFTYSSIEKTNT
jgi:hypothetical protein